MLHEVLMHLQSHRGAWEHPLQRREVHLGSWNPLVTCATHTSNGAEKKDSATLGRGYWWLASYS